VPINQNPCPPCPTIVEIREVPIVIQGPPGPPGKDGEDGEDGEGGKPVLLMSTKENGGQYAQVLDFTQSVKGKTSGTLPSRISRVVVRVVSVTGSLALYGVTETGEKVGGFGTVALVLNDVIVHQYSLNRFQDTQIVVPHGLDQTVEVFVSPLVACQVAVLDEGDRWGVFQVVDPENLPEVQSNQLT
jgi:hypothetical protein